MKAATPISCLFAMAFLITGLLPCHGQSITFDPSPVEKSHRISFRSLYLGMTEDAAVTVAHDMGYDIASSKEDLIGGNCCGPRHEFSITVKHPVQPDFAPDCKSNPTIPDCKLVSVETLSLTTESVHGTFLLRDLALTVKFPFWNYVRVLMVPAFQAYGKPDSMKAERRPFVVQGPNKGTICVLRWHPIVDNPTAERSLWLGDAIHDSDDSCDNYSKISEIQLRLSDDTVTHEPGYRFE